MDSRGSFLSLEIATLFAAMGEVRRSAALCTFAKVAGHIDSLLGLIYFHIWVEVEIKAHVVYL